MRAPLLLLFLVLAVAADAQDLAGFERVFIPFHGANITGINGSEFRVAGVSIGRVPYSYWPHCDFFSTTPVFGRVDGGPGIPLVCAGGSRGRLLFVEQGAADQISFGYNLFSSAAEESAPAFHATIPVARERDFKRSRFHIVVPYGEGRVTLRVYEMSGRANAAVRVIARVSILGWAASNINFVVPVTNREGSDPSYPSFVEVPLGFGCFVVSPRVCTPWDAAIDIEPLAEGEYWAVVSRTRNVTQQITL
jgi:hypothetical protein